MVTRSLRVALKFIMTESGAQYAMIGKISVYFVVFHLFTMMVSWAQGAMVGKRSVYFVVFHLFTMMSVGHRVRLLVRYTLCE